MYQINEDVKDDVNAIMEAEGAPAISEEYRSAVTAKLVENQMAFLQESADPTNVTGSAVANWDPVLIKMVRRAAPKMLAFDIAGVQPMTGPNGLIFAIRSRYTNQTGTEALHNEANTAFSGTGTHGGDTSGFALDSFGVGDPAATTETGKAMDRATGEALGTTSGSAWAEMAFSIEKTSVEAKTRALKATWTRELETDLKKIHGISADKELGNILSTEIVAEQDREMLRTMNIAAKVADTPNATAGLYDVQADADGRWMQERYKALAFQFDLLANKIGVDTRRGRGNFIVASANVVSALANSGMLQGSADTDVNGSLYAGVLNGKMKVYIDPYATVDYATVGYRGANAWDAGVYFAPYVPLEMYRTIAEDSFQPAMGFKTRYGVVANPFAANTASGAKAGKGLGQGENEYFQKLRIKNIV